MRLKRTLIGILAATMIITPVLPASAAVSTVPADVQYAASITREFRNSVEFVSQLYQGLLGRDPDVTGLKSWLSALESGKETGSSIFAKFVHSAEFEKKTRYDDGLFYRSVCDTIMTPVHGYYSESAYIKYLSSREKTLENLLNSDDFKTFCGQAGITPGTYKANPQFDKKYRTWNFITELYREVLWREPDDSGHAAWSEAMLSGKKTASQVMKGFMKSGETRWDSSGASNRRFAETMFNAITLPRGYDHNRYSWMADPVHPYYQALESGRNRWDVLDDFFDSKEFTNFCTSYGLRK